MNALRTLASIALATACATVVPIAGHAQQSRPPAARPAPAPGQGSPPPPVPAPQSSPSVPSTPQQTTASFADWTLRCSRLGPSPGTQFCEIAQGIQREDRPVAQLAIGRLAKGQPLQLTILVPVNASFASAPMLFAAREAEGVVVELAWRRCLPAGCTADAALSDDVVQRMRTWSDQARIGFADAVGRTLTLPFSPRGLAQALDALAKEEGN